MKVRFFNIVWDTDGDDYDHLPLETTIETEDNFDPHNDGADLLSDDLSDEYGFCVHRFQYEVLPADYHTFLVYFFTDGRLTSFQYPYEQSANTVYDTLTNTPDVEWVELLGVGQGLTRLKFWQKQ